MSGSRFPFCLLAAFAPSIEVLIVARIGGGISAGMAYPTTLALITALWAPGPGRTHSIALWSALGGAIAALGPLVSGFLLEQFEWGSVFLVTLPLAFVALFMAWRFVPAHVNETTDPVDNLGGILSALLVGTLILAINFAPVPNMGALVIGLAVICIAATVAFVIRQRRTKDPLYDLDIAARPTFWVAAVAGIIVFGSLMGAMFIGQQYLQNVLGYSTLEAGTGIIPAAIAMVIVAPRSAVLVEARGARFTLLLGYVFVFGGFLTMLLLWGENSSYLVVALGYTLVGIGVGFAGTPASRSLTGSVPVTRAGMASGHRRPPARPRRRDHAVDLRRAPDRRLRGRRRRGPRRRPAERRFHHQRAEPADDVVRGSRRRRRAVPAVQHADHRRGARSRSWPATSGPTWPASSPSSWARRSSSSSSRATTRSVGCWRSITSRTPPRRRRHPPR